MFDPKMIEDLTQEDRAAALAHLLKLHTGPVKLDGDDNWAIPLFDEEPLPAGCYKSISVPPLMPFKPRKLVILEPTIEVVEHEVFTERTPVLIEKSKTWYGRKTHRVTETTLTARTVEHRRFETQPRGIWEVTALFVGQWLQFPASANISGDMFGPQGELFFKDKCPPGLRITVSIKNCSKSPAKFRAVVLGRAEFEEVKPPFPTRLPSELDA